jgi:hypothetical protein
MSGQSIQCEGGWCGSTLEIIKEQLLDFLSLVT